MRRKCILRECSHNGKKENWGRHMGVGVKLMDGGKESGRRDGDGEQRWEKGGGRAYLWFKMQITALLMDLQND